MGEIDTELVKELDMYIMNDSDIYRQTYVPLAKNYARKKFRGKFNKELAIRGLKNTVVMRGIEKYRKEFGLGVVNDSTKKAIAEELYSSHEELVEDELNKLKEKKKK